MKYDVLSKSDASVLSLSHDPHYTLHVLNRLNASFIPGLRILRRHISTITYWLCAPECSDSWMCSWIFWQLNVSSRNEYTSGLITMMEWADSMSSVLNLDLPWRTLRAKLVDQDENGSVEMCWLLNLNCKEYGKLRKGFWEALFLIISVNFYF